jgi:hypothetical protein
VNGKAIDQVFAGNVCPIPVIQNTLITWVGVFAGTVNDGTLSTSTPALVKCVPCITDGDKIPLPPPDDVYNQIIELINSGLLRGPQGEKGEKGEKGEAGAVKFVPVSELPTENIEEDAIYLVPVADSTEEENRFTEYAYIDGKWETLGAISVQVDHSEYAKKTDLSNVDYLAYVNYKGSHYEGFPGLFQYDGGMIGGFFKSTTSGDGGNRFRIAKARQSEINARTPSDYHDGGIHGANHCKPIVPANIDYAVISVLTNYKGELLTDESKESACETIGATTKKYVDELIANLQAQIDELKG